MGNSIQQSEEKLISKKLEWNRNILKLIHVKKSINVCSWQVKICVETQKNECNLWKLSPFKRWKTVFRWTYDWKQ
jgi:hypothetical protein